MRAIPSALQTRFEGHLRRKAIPTLCYRPIGNNRIGDQAWDIAIVSDPSHPEKRVKVR